MLVGLVPRHAWTCLKIGWTCCGRCQISVGFRKNYSIRTDRLSIDSWCPRRSNLLECRAAPPCSATSIPHAESRGAATAAVTSIVNTCIMKRARSSLQNGSGTGAADKAASPELRGTSEYFQAPPAKQACTDSNGVQGSEEKSASCTADVGCQGSSGDGPGSSSADRLERSYFDVDCETLARKLLGCVIAHRLPTSGEVVRGLIVETEAYLGGPDKAAHSFEGKRTERNAAMFMAPGTLYVYQIYGVNHCSNVSARGDGAAVLFRAIAPADDSSERAMRKARPTSEEGARKLKLKDIGGGPGRLGKAMSITVALTGIDTTASDAEVWFEPGSSDGPTPPSTVVVSKRVGVDYAGEWAGKPLRFYLMESPCVSVRDKEAEKKLKSAN